jgi:hypothetical protein
MIRSCTRILLCLSLMQGCLAYGQTTIDLGTRVSGTLPASTGSLASLPRSYFTVGTGGELPATCIAGQKMNVSDATTPSYLGALTGGSTTFTPVVCKGSNTWISY